MDKELFETGLKIRSEVLGKEYVENSLKSADEFNMPFQEFVTAYCWGGGLGPAGADAQATLDAQPRDDPDPQPAA